MIIIMCEVRLSSRPKGNSIHTHTACISIYLSIYIYIYIWACHMLATTKDKSKEMKNVNKEMSNERSSLGNSFPYDHISEQLDLL